MKPWSFLVNPFIAATNTSYRSMKKIGSYTVAALQAKQNEPFFASLFTTIQPLYNSYNNAYNTWLSQKGFQKGNTSNLTQLLVQLRSEKIKDWDISIQQIYKDHTPQYVALLPYHRTPFQSGSQLDKIAAVNALITAIGSDTALQAVKANAQAFYNQLITAYEVQKGAISSTGTNSDAVDAERVALGIGLYGILGLLMDYFKNDPEKVAMYFDMQTIRNHEQTLFKHDIKAGETLLALTHTFDVDEEVILINRGNGELHFALVASSTEGLGATFVSLAANTEQTVLASSLGNIANCRYLKVANTSATTNGAYTIELI